MYSLCNGDVLKIDEVLKKNVHEVLTWLCYEKDYNKLQANLRKRQSKAP